MSVRLRGKNTDNLQNRFFHYVSESATEFLSKIKDIHLQADSVENVKLAYEKNPIKLTATNALLALPEELPSIGKPFGVITKGVFTMFVKTWKHKKQKEIREMEQRFDGFEVITAISKLYGFCLAIGMCFI